MTSINVAAWVEDKAIDMAALAYERQKEHLPDHLGLEWTEIRTGFVSGRLTVRKHHLAMNGFLSAASVIGLADTACGYGAAVSLPKGAYGLTTIELKANFLGTVRDGGLACEARLVHGGRTTQVWDAEARSETTGRTVALFRCTQSLLYAPV